MQTSISLTHYKILSNSKIFGALLRFCGVLKSSLLMIHLISFNFPRVKIAKSYFLVLIIISISLASLIYVKSRSGHQCANSISCLNDLSGNFEMSKGAIFNGRSITIPDLAQSENLPIVLGQNTADNKRIEVDLTKQHLYAYEGENLVLDFPVSTGKWYPTPTGNFRIWVKLHYTRMAGGNQSAGTYYNLPNVPFTMYFYNENISKSRGFGLHGAYWHNNFGHPMSHGCVNIKTEDAERLYYWANPAANGNVTYADNNNPGTLLKIFGVTPKE